MIKAADSAMYRAKRGSSGFGFLDEISAVAVAASDAVLHLAWKA